MVLTPLPDDRGTTLRAAGVSANWRAETRCGPADADLFFGAEEQRAIALAICRGCEVQPECRAEAEAQGDIGRDGYTNHGQVVGGCGPKPVKAGQKPVVMRPCFLVDCRQMFAVRGPGANMYCSAACAAIARKVSRTRPRRRAS